MLEKVREPWRKGRGKSILAYVLFGFICLTFVFVGVTPDRNGIGGHGTAATVNDKVISAFELQQRVQAIEDQMGDAMKSLPAAQRQMTSRRLRENALEELVNYELVYQSAERVGVLPTVAATRNLIVNIPAFQEEGRFARDRYNQYLQYSNTTAAEFETRVRKDVVVGQLRELFMTALAPAQALANLNQEAQQTKVNLQFVKINASTLTPTGPSPAAVNEYLAQEESKKKVQSYYNSHKDEFSTQTEVRARHILIKGDGDDAKKKIEDIRKEAEKGDFAELAKKHSEDEGSKVRGGDLDYFSRGRMVPEFEDVAFSIPVGKVSDPVKSAFGYHLIKVEDRRDGKTKSLEDVQASIAQKLLTEELKEKEFTSLEETLKKGGDVSPWLARYKLKWDETGEVPLTQSYLPKIEAGAEAVEAALSLKQEGETYPKLVRSGPDAYIIRLKKLTRPGAVAAAKPASSQFASEGSETMGLWAEELRKSARIRRNESLLNN